MKKGTSIAWAMARRTRTSDRGAGIAPDRVAAMAWLLRATRGGSDLARPFLTAVRASLTPAELSLALARSSEPLPPVSGGVA